MNAVNRNREIYEETGLMLTGLPDQYVNDHPTMIVAEMNGLHTVYSKRPDESITFDVIFKSPEINFAKRKSDRSVATGYFTIDLEMHPKNRTLLELIKYLDYGDAEVEFYGRQYNNQYYVNAILPRNDRDLDKEAFLYYISVIGIPFVYPSWMKIEPNEGKAMKYSRLYYNIFRYKYPKGIRTYLDEHLGESRYNESVKRFIMMDWSSPKLNLPTTQEARRILNETVYGMQEVKERLLEFLEEVRRSGSLAKNLLLVGPPGTGKTTLMQAVAKMLRLPMSVVPMSACSDLETFIGFAKTYTGSQEGLLTTALLAPVYEHPDGKRETMHQIAQVLFLNELDKASSGNNRYGSVQAALLRMMDENRNFFDVYHQVNIDLSNVVIVADSNDITKIESALRDRFEVIEIPPYSEEEKAFIFRNFTFPQVLKEKKVASTEVSVTKEAVELIVSSIDSPGIRDQKKIAKRIVGNYLLHHSWRKSTVRYTPEMVSPFLPKPDVRNTILAQVPGSIRSAVVIDDKTIGVDVQCIVKRAKEPSFRLFGTSDQVLRQELAAAALCAARYLKWDGFDVKAQIYGLPDHPQARRQLSFPLFVAILSAVYHCDMEGIYYGETTMLGGMSNTACGNPDAILRHADQRDVKRVYTATGFSERLKNPHSAEVVEFLDAETAATILLGNAALKAI